MEGKDGSRGYGENGIGRDNIRESILPFRIKTFTKLLCSKTLIVCSKHSIFPRRRQDNIRRRRSWNDSILWKSEPFCREQRTCRVSDRFVEGFRNEHPDSGVEIFKECGGVFDGCCSREETQGGDPIRD
jgi:hypothetical protein